MPEVNDYRCSMYANKWQNHRREGKQIYMKNEWGESWEEGGEGGKRVVDGVGAVYLSLNLRNITATTKCMHGSEQVSYLRS